MRKIPRNRIAFRSPFYEQLVTDIEKNVRAHLSDATTLFMHCDSCENLHVYVVTLENNIVADQYLQLMIEPKNWHEMVRN